MFKEPCSDHLKKHSNFLYHCITLRTLFLWRCTKITKSLTANLPTVSPHSAVRNAPTLKIKVKIRNSEILAHWQSPQIGQWTHSPFLVFVTCASYAGDLPNPFNPPLSWRRGVGWTQFYGNDEIFGSLIMNLVQHNCCHFEWKPPQLHCFPASYKQGKLLEWYVELYNQTLAPGMCQALWYYISR